MTIYSNEKVVEFNKQFYKNRAKSYDEQCRSSGFYDKYLGKYIEKLSAGFDEIRILDIGTGTGFALCTAAKYLKTEKTWFYGCDISEDMLFYAQKSMPHANLKLYDGIKLPEYNEKFNLILFCSVLHHIYDPVPLLMQSLKYLDSKGKIFITQEPNPVVNGFLTKMIEFLSFKKDDETRYAEFHQYITPGIPVFRLVDVLKQKGFNVKVSYTNAALADSLDQKFGFIGKMLGKIVMLFKNKYMSLSYSIEATLIK